MSHHSHRPHRTRRSCRQAVTAAALASALLAVGPVAAAGAQQDLRSPDARDAALASEARNYQDLRSPDARDAGVSAEAQAYQDLRSPDARDVGRAPSSLSSPSTPTVESSGTDCGDVAIVAGGALLLLGAAGIVLFSRRKATARKARTAVVSS